MSIGDILSAVGRGAATAGRVAGAVLEPIGRRTAEVLSGEAPQIDEERRQQALQLSNEQRELKANELEQQLEMGRKYGTLTPDQQKQYVDAIIGLYSKPEDQGNLLRRTLRAIYPKGAVRQTAQALPNATPIGGTARADLNLLDEKQGLRPVPGVRPFLNKADGQYYQPMYTRSGQVVNELVEDYQPPAQKTGAGKSPPLPGNQLPSDAAGPDGQPIPEADRNAGKLFVQYQGSWWPVAKPKPVFRTIRGHSVLVDAQTGAILRDLGPAGTAKVTKRQTLQPGDDGQMHLVTLTSVTTPEGATIDVEPEEQQAEPDASPTKTPEKGVTPGSVLRKTGAKPVGESGPVVPGLSTMAKSKNPVIKASMAEAGKELPVLEGAKNQINDYINNGVFTGAGDLDLQHAFFTATQPSAGFRMTKVQQDILQNSQDWLNSLEAKAYHYATGTWFSEKQREQIAKAALDAIADKEKALKNAIGEPRTGPLLDKTGVQPAGGSFDWSTYPEAK
jgi:hypothetical protein